ncbi:MAG: hypothetical protein GF334_10645 [Candidatus Altiarchaeales archaeon]|nr:hypothetical protein [Candidatus Altiarchaeales archaeon]
MYAIDLEDVKISLRDLAAILQVVALVMLVPIIVTSIYTSSQSSLEFFKELSAFIIPSAAYYLLYVLIRLTIKTDAETKSKHGLLAVVIAWFLIPLIGALPFLIRGALNPVDAFFESMSGWATTGMTMIARPELVAADLIFYRSLTHLVGGVGIIALGLMIFLQSGKAATDYYVSEVGGGKIRPGIRGTIFETWKIYLLYAFIGIVLFYVAGMNSFDAVNHAFAAIATGGFSTHAESIGYFQSIWIELVAILLMLAGSISFLLHFQLFNGDWGALKRNIEAKYMLVLSVICFLVVFLSLAKDSAYDPSYYPHLLRDTVFQVVSSISCTGFGTVDTGGWPQLAQTALMFLMYVGGFYGSTAGGIKLLRFIVVVKAVSFNLRKMILPKNAIITLRMGDKPIMPDEIVFVMGLSMVYLMVALVGASSLMWLGFTGYESMELSLSAMGNVGIVFVTGDAWYHMADAGKIILALLMWIGRLEIFPILIFLGPLYFRKKR